jgi:hypothetical protein
MFLRRGLFLVSIAFGTPLSAQHPNESSWQNLKQLQPGQKVEVIDLNLKTFQGTFVDASETAISLAGDKGHLVVQYDDVLRVGSHGGRRRSNALKGAMIGALAGLAVGAWVDYRDDVDSTDPGSNHGKIGASLFGAGVGAAIGVAFPGYQTIYRAKSAGAPGRVRTPAEP